MKKNKIETIDIYILDDTDELRIEKAINSAFKVINIPLVFAEKLNVIPLNKSIDLISKLKEKRWRDVLFILIDWELKNPENEGEDQKLYGKNLVDEIIKHNPQIVIYGITAYDLQKNEKLIESKEFKSFREHPIDIDILSKDYFLNKGGANSSLQRIFNEICKKLDTPFFDAFSEYVLSATKSWHVPGHNRGEALKNSTYAQDFYNFFGERTFTSDHDIPKRFGSIFSDSDNSILKETQKEVAKTFSTDQTYFVTNGNSAANNIILSALLKPGTPLLVARSCHKSIHYAIILSGARPTYLESAYSEKYEIMAPPIISDIENELKKKEKGYYRLLVVTGCGYEGFVMDIKRLKQLCDYYGTELLVDEAWYGYSNFHPTYLKTSATRLDVPYVTQSAHKMLSALRQSAFIHVSKKAQVDKNRLKDAYNTFTSTSPQYQLIASMEVAAMQMRMEGFELIDKALERAELFRKDCKNQLEIIKLIERDDFLKEFKKVGFGLDSENIFLDPLKISFDISELNTDVTSAYEFIRDEAQVDLIKYTKNCIQILFTIGTSFDISKPATLATTLRKLEKTYGKISTHSSKATNKAPEISKIEYTDNTPRDFFYMERKEVAISSIDTKERPKSATLVTPYPPGIPLLLPGEIITEKHKSYLGAIISSDRLSVHGLNKEKIFIIDENKS